MAKHKSAITEGCFSCQNMYVCQKLPRSCEKWKNSPKSNTRPFARKPSITSMYLGYWCTYEQVFCHSLTVRTVAEPQQDWRSHLLSTKNSTGDICQFLCNKKSINNLLTWIYISGWLDPSHLHKSSYSMRHRARWEAGLRWVGRKQERETMSFPLPLPITDCILTLYYATCYRVTLQHGIQNWNSETRNQNPAFEQPSQMYT